MNRAVIAIAIFPLLLLRTESAQDRTRNIWEAQYKDRSAVEMARQFESASRPVYRHRGDIIKLLDLRPGMSAAEVGAGSGFLSRLMTQQVGPSGQVIATELDMKMVTYMNERAKAEGISNLRAVAGRIDATGLETDSMDVIAVVNTYSFFDRPDQMMRSISSAIKPAGLVLIVDFHRSPDQGTDPQAVIKTATAARLTFIDRSDVIPSHFALRFRKN